MLLLIVRTRVVLYTEVVVAAATEARRTHFLHILDVLA